MPRLNTRITNLSSTSDSARLAFYRTAFPKRAALLAKHWRWWYRVRPGRPEPLVALNDQDQIVGQAALIPFDLELKGKRIPAIWFIDYFVLSEWQGQGVGQSLAREWMKLCPIRITLTRNEASLRIFRKLGWHESGHYFRAASPVGLLKKLWLPQLMFRNAPSIQMSPVDSNVLKEFIPTPSEGISVARDEAWFQWRILENPLKGKHQIATCEGVKALIRTVTDEARRLHVLYFSQASAKAKERLCRGLVRWAFEKEIDLVWLNDSGEDFRKQLRFTLPGRVPLHLVYHTEDPEIERALSHGKLELQAIDGDNDILYAGA